MVKKAVKSLKIEGTNALAYFVLTLVTLKRKFNNIGFRTDTECRQILRNARQVEGLSKLFVCVTDCGDNSWGREPLLKGKAQYS